MGELLPEVLILRYETYIPIDKKACCEINVRLIFQLKKLAMK
jgi:hypothetical protein